MTRALFSMMLPFMERRPPGLKIEEKKGLVLREYQPFLQCRGSLSLVAFIPRMIYCIVFDSSVSLSHPGICPMSWSAATKLIKEEAISLTMLAGSISMISPLL